jgi:uncharacterized protein
MEIQNNINKILKACKGFQWDKGNSLKSWIKHKVSCAESEQVFFNSPVLIAQSDKKTDIEIRYFALGYTNSERLLFVVFTIRAEYIHIISPRDMNKKEKEVYLNA